MRRIFGTKKAAAPAAPAPTLDDSIAKADARVTGLDDKINKLNEELRGYNAQLKKVRGPAAASIKQRALQALKRRNMYQQQRDAIMATSFNMEQTNFAISSIKDTQETVAAMRSAATTLREEHKKMDLNAIEDMHDELEDLMYENEEIQEVMSRSYGLPSTVDEADLESELAGLEDEWAAEDAEAATASPGRTPSYLVPSAPTTELPTADTAHPETARAYGLPVAPTHAT